MSSVIIGNPTQTLAVSEDTTLHILTEESVDLDPILNHVHLNPPNQFIASSDALDNTASFPAIRDL